VAHPPHSKAFVILSEAKDLLFVAPTITLVAQLFADKTDAEVAPSFAFFARVGRDEPASVMLVMLQKTDVSKKSVVTKKASDLARIDRCECVGVGTIAIKEKFVRRRWWLRARFLDRSL
jgi:hypothetical protein